MTRCLASFHAADDMYRRGTRVVRPQSTQHEAGDESTPCDAAAPAQVAMCSHTFHGAHGADADDSGQGRDPVVRAVHEQASTTRRAVQHLNNLSPPDVPWLPACSPVRVAVCVPVEAEGRGCACWRHGAAICVAICVRLGRLRCYRDERRCGFKGISAARWRWNSFTQRESTSRG